MGTAGRVIAAGAAAPFTRRTRRELAFCLLGLPFGLAALVPLAGFSVTINLALLASGPPWAVRGNPSWLSVLLAVAVAALLIVLLVATARPARWRRRAGAWPATRSRRRPG